MDKDHRGTGEDIPFFHPTPTAERPLAGMTILVVEDSRFASEALRLMCLRSGARIRRADCLASAHRHLNTYRPTVAVVDLGLPDGSGLTLIAEMHRDSTRVPVLLATSGADRAEAERAALQAGADGFLPKPVESLGAFQSEILRHLPAEMHPRGPRDFAAAAFPEICWPLEAVPIISTFFWPGGTGDNGLGPIPCRKRVILRPELAQERKTEHCGRKPPAPSNGNGRDEEQQGPPRPSAPHIYKPSSAPRRARNSRRARASRSRSSRP